MRAVLLQEYGAPPVCGERVDPVVAEGLSIVEVTAAPVAPLDLLCASGTSYFGQLPLPYVPGVQGVGVVGTSSTLPPGTRVWFATPAGMTPGDGSMAERCAVSPQDVVPLPEGVSDAQAAAIGTSGIAAWMSLTWRARLREGEKVLVLGAGGVVGQCAVAVARRLGAARVVAMCRSEQGAARARQAGADEVVRVAGQLEATELAARYVDAAAGPVDVVVDPVFGVAAEAAVTALAPGGRLVNLGGLSGDRAELSSAVLRSKTVSVLGYTNNAITAEQRAQALVSVLSLAAAGDLAVEQVAVPLEEVGFAWSRAAAGDGVRVLLLPGGPS